MSSRGLPSRPGPRARSSSRDDGRRAPASLSNSSQPSSRTPRPQRSAADLSSSHARSFSHQAPPMPSQTRARTPSSRSGSSMASSSSASSGGSSFLDRMKGSASVSSSRTSLDDAYNEPPPKRGWAASSRGRQGEAARQDSYDEEPEEQDQSSLAAQASGYGAVLWGTMSKAAGNLTINVGKAWASGIRLADGEETPPGGESRLTKAMKAYHLERARSPADLPSWLFEEHERRVTAPPPEPEEYEDRFRGPAVGPQRGALRDIYDRAAASSTPAPKPTRREYGGGEGGGTTPSRATDRLRAIREAKKGQVHNQDGDAGRRGVDADRRPERNAVTRVGLPRGPGGARF